MSNNRDNRKREMEAARQAGRDAYDAGKSIHTEPVHSVDRGRWRDGWQEREFEAQMHDQACEEMAIQSLINDVPCEATRLALEAIWEKANA